MIIIKDFETHYPYDCGRRYSRGFTLIELIVTLTILAIIVAIATPMILTQLCTMEAKRIRSTIENTLTLAKAESLIRRHDIIVCLSDKNDHCQKDSTHALLLFVDQDDNQDFDAATDLLLSQESLEPRYGNTHLRAGRRDYVKFYGDTGRPRGHFGHIKYCPTSTYNKAMYLISFNQMGLIKYKPNTTHPTDCP